MLAAWFKNLFVKLYIALDEAQRKRATEIIWQHRHLIPKCDENSGEKKIESGDESHQFWA
jgi:hypothetical protein